MTGNSEIQEQPEHPNRWRHLWAKLQPWCYPVSLLAGATLWTLSLPPRGWAILSVAAFVPIFLAVQNESPRRALAWGWAGGFLWEAGTLWWLVPTLTNYGDMGIPTAVLLIAGLCAILGLTMALFLGSLAFLSRGLGRWGLVLAPCLWVLAEWLRGHLFSGLPWWGPGYSLSLFPIMLQSAALFGVLGLSFLAVLAASALALGILDRKSPQTLAAALPAILLFAGAVSYGISHEEWKTDRSQRLPVGYLQPEIAQDQKWDLNLAESTEKRFFELSEPFGPYHLKILVWPESCTPGIWDLDEKLQGQVGELATRLGSPILLGTILKAQGGGVQNGAVLVMPGGKEGGRYAKRHLVPFGEYIPLRGLLGIASPIVENVGDFVPGKVTEPMPSPAGKLGVSICFEGIFPDLVRKEVLMGAELLINITNDAWYAGTPGPDQHFFIQRVRAVEAGRYLIRSANGGVSGVVNPRGRLEAATPRDQCASWWGEIVPLKDKTLYVRIGDTWVLIPLVLVLASGIIAWWRRSQGQ
jgi:apolipoprotein N-acyltransferase